MNSGRRGYLWSDAWLLTAIYGAALDGPPNLARVIGTGDLINHAIFTLAELNGGLGRLEVGGFISVRDHLFELTRTGEEATAVDPGARKGVFHHMETVRKRLGASDRGPGTAPDEAGDPENRRVYVTEEEFREAFEEYRKLLRKRPKPKTANEATDGDGE
jgi:hypothetical protein